jgi:hypothetical protein
MATSTYLSNPVVTVNNVDLTDQCTAASLIYRFDQLESTSFGNGGVRTYVKGLQNNEVTLTLYNSFAATETWATLSALVGDTFAVTIKPTSGAPSPSNPLLTITGGFLAELPNAFTMGELSTVDVTIVGGSYTVVTTGP